MASFASDAGDTPENQRILYIAKFGCLYTIFSYDAFSK